MPKAKLSTFKKNAQTSCFRIGILIVIGLIIWGGSYVKQKYDQRYLVIKEWGIRLELPWELRGETTYTMGANDSLGMVVGFSSTEVNAKNTSAKDKVGFSFAIARYKVDEVDPYQGSRTPYQGRRLHRVNGYEYYVVLNETPSDYVKSCAKYVDSKNPQKTCEALQKLRVQLSNAYDTVKATK